MDADEVLAGIAMMHAGYAKLAAAGIDSLSHAQLLPTQSHRMIARLTAEASPVAFGAKSWRELLRLRLRISPSEAGRRLDEAKQLVRVPRCRGTVGAAAGPTAAAQPEGDINGEHVA